MKPRGAKEMFEHPIMLDETLDRLEESLKALQSKPDNRRRWTRQAIERLRVSELAAQYVLQQLSRAGLSAQDEIWDAAVKDAVFELRKAGKIR
jgi:hypothetical protein